MFLPRIRSVYVSASAASLLMFTAGTSCCWSSPEIPKLMNATENPIERILTDAEISWITSLLTLGAVIGPFFYGYLADRIGRKPAMLLSGVPFVMAYIMLAIGKVVEIYYCARILAGIGVGGTFTIVPMYIGEIAESKNRGLISCLIGGVCSIGLFFSVALGPFKSIEFFNAVLAIPPLLFLILFGVLAEESPIYLVKTKEIEKAETVLHNLGRSPEVSKKEVMEMQAEYENKEENNKFDMMEMLRSRALMKGIISTVGLLVFQQLSGINAILFYSQTIFAEAGTTLEPHICTIILVAVQSSSSFIVPFVVDRFGRKICLSVSALGMVVSEGPLALYCYLRTAGIDMENYSWIPLVTLTTFIIAFNFGLGPLPWTILSEIFATKYRSFATAFVSTICWFVSFLVTKYFHLAMEIFGLGNIFFFSTFCCLVAIIFCCFYIVETKGRTLQEIQDLLNR